ncbi:MAG: hypothetical protein AABZ34_13355 [Nitrospirota bacterium]
MSSIKSRLLVSMAMSATMSRSCCRHRQAERLTEPVRTVVDDSGSLAITAWTCAVCGDLIEEIRILPRQRVVPFHLSGSTYVPKVRGGRPTALSVPTRTMVSAMTSRSV